MVNIQERGQGSNRPVQGNNGSGRSKSSGSNQGPNASRPERGSAASQGPVPGKGLGQVFLLGGLALGAAGAALILVPEKLPKGAEIVSKLQSQGLGGLSLGLAGGVFIALGLTLRSIANAQWEALTRLGQPREMKVPHSLLSMADDQGKIRIAMGNMQTELLANKTRQDSIMGALGGIASSVQSEQSQANAMFRLAASLDQLGARLEQRLQGQQNALRETLQEVSSTVYRQREEVMKSIEGIRTEVHSAEAAAREAGQVYQESEALESSQAAPFEDDLGYEEVAEETSSEDDLQVQVTFEEEPSLGLLNEFDEMGHFHGDEEIEAPNAPLPSPNPTGTWPPTSDMTSTDSGSITFDGTNPYG